MNEYKVIELSEDPKEMEHALNAQESTEWKLFQILDVPYRPAAGVIKRDPNMKRRFLAVYSRAKE